MNRSSFLIELVAIVAIAALVGIVGYNVGVSNGIVQSGKIVAAAPAAPVPYAYPYPYYGWHPWGFGFFLAPFFVFVIFVTLIRAAFWRSRWSYYGRCGHAFDEWHRRAHEREGMEDRGDDSDRR